MQIADALKHARQQLQSSETAQLDAEILLCKVLNCERSHLYAYPEKELTNDNIESFNHYIALRIEGQPIAHITEQKEFWSLLFQVNEHTLIPRPETEILVETALNYIPENTQSNVLDLGTGSGAIAIAIASERPLATITATDKSKHALSVAKNNAQVHQVNNINFIYADWFNIENNNTYDVIVSNPPYICNDDSHLQEGDVRFEPLSALISGKEGLDDLQTIISKATNYLNRQGWLLVEHGYNQAKAVQNLFNENNFKSVTTIKDHSENDRVTIGQRNE